MRHGRALLGLLNVLLVGCVTGGPAHTALRPERGSPAAAADDPDAVVLYVALVERPLGDRYLNQDLWALADEQVVPVEQRAVLEANGFRVAQVGGIIPAGLLGLLSSERSCVNPRCVRLEAGHPTAVPLGPVAPQCRFELHADGAQTPVELEQARGTLVVTPAPDRDGRTRLRFTPQVQHGEAQAVPRPVADPAGVYNWEMHEERPTESYDALSWEVALRPNEYVLVGTRYERPGTLGHHCFLSREPPEPAQRLLVIRTGRPAAAAETADGEDTLPAARQPPPALHAFCTAAYQY